jgi:hypothetical protein
MKELAIPPVVRDDPASIEVLRAWVAHGGQHVSLNISVWRDPFVWGMFLVDLARHLANAYMQESGVEFDETLVRIKDGFLAEINSPTDFPRGFIEGTS